MRNLYKIILVVAGLIVLWQVFRDRDTHTRLFCAYERVFVEFEEDGHTWGTMFLDHNGKPIPCTDSPNVERIRQLHII